MSILRQAIGQMIANMGPEERSETIREVTGQALALMDSAERLTLTQHLFILLLEGLDQAARRELAAALSARLTASAGE